MSAMLPSSRRLLTSWLLASATMWSALLFTSSSIAMAQSSADGVLTWIDETGQHKIQAKFLKIDGANVLLQTPEGKQIPVPYAKLNLSSQLQAKKLANPQAFEAPPLPSTQTPPPLSSDPFPADATIEQFMDTMLGSLKEGRADVLWHALPKSAQADIEVIVTKSAEVLGPKLLKQIQAVTPNILTIVRDKRSFIVANPRLARQPELAKSVNIGLQSSEPLVELLTKPATWSSENFKQENVGAWIALFSNDALQAFAKTTDQLKAAGVRGATSLSSDLKTLTYKVIEKTADTATVEISSSSPSPPQKTVYKKIEGKWCDADSADMLNSFADARRHLENMDKAAIDQVRTQVSTALTFANGILGTLASANTAQEFNAAIEPYMGIIEPALQAGMASAAAARGRGGPGGPGPGGLGPGAMDRRLGGPGGGPPANIPRSQPPTQSVEK